MKVVQARTGGFCIGVKRALDMVLKAINESQTRIYTYGPLIHNPQVLDLLRERGITVLKPGESVPEGLVVMRFGVGPPRYADNAATAAFIEVGESVFPFLRQGQWRVAL